MKQRLYSFTTYTGLIHIISSITIFMLVAASPVHPIIIRSDVSDSKYIVSEDAFPALVDLPESGHGTLISNKWVLTAAHTVRSGSIITVKINNKPRTVSEIFTYPGFLDTFTKLEKAMEGVISLDKTPQKAHMIMSTKVAMHDIALIKLENPVQDVEPTELYRKTNELKKIAKIYGKGATGNGKVGVYPDSPNRNELRQAYNRIVSANKKWLKYKFDCGAKSLPLEGVIGSGDSGGPVLIKENNKWKLAGVASGVRWYGEDVSKFRFGTCGQEFYNSRISYYSKWIDKIIATSE